MTRRFLYIQSSLPLLSLAEACLTLTPKIYCPTPEELFLEIAGTEKLFGGEAAILYRAEHLIELFIHEAWQGMSRVRLVLTDRPEWARPLALQERIFLAPGQGQEAFYDLPLERLVELGDASSRERECHLRQGLVDFLEKMGLHRIGEFAALPSSAIVRRFAKVGVELQAWVHGKREWCLPLWQPSEALDETLDAEAVESLTELLFCIRQALIRLECRLKGRSLMARQLRLEFSLESGKKMERVLDLAAPTQEAHHLLKLLKDFLNGMEWDSPLASLRVEVSDSERWEPGQTLLFENREDHFHDLAQYVTRLRASLGKESVGAPQLLPSHLPERSWKVTWPPQVASLESEYPVRPLILLDPPERWAPPKRGKLERSENILCEWWEPGGRRHYFIATTNRGERLWVFFDEESHQWYVQGLFD